MAAPSVGRGKGSLAPSSSAGTLSEAVARYVEPGVSWLARFIISHWLLTANAMLFLFVGLPFLAPVLEAIGWTVPAKAIYLAYRPTCHQLPERSYFVHGHQVAVCARCSALYLSFLGGGLVYALVRVIRGSRRVPAWPKVPLWAVGCAVLPLAIDGTTQLLGLRESTNGWRTITGGLAGGVTAAFVYPYMHVGFAEARQVWEMAHRGRPIEGEGELNVSFAAGEAGRAAAKADGRATGSTQ